MRGRRQSYTTYSLGVAVAWAAILGVLAMLGDKERLRRILPVFGGWWMGWTSATIARYVYQPPSSGRRAPGETSRAADEDRTRIISLEG